MQVDPLPKVLQKDLTHEPAREPRQEFKNVLLAKVSRPPLLHSGFAPDTTASLTSTGPDKIHIGTLSEATPTVFALLRQHSEFANRWEDIIHSSANKDLDFRHLSTGTDVFLEKNSGALILVSPQKQRQLRPRDVAASPSKSVSYVRIALGTINSNAPTVSHLLEKNDRTRADTWEILEKPINRQKDFANIRPGTEIFLDYSTGELIWSSPKETGPQAVRQASETGPSQNRPSEKGGGGESQPVSLGRISPTTPTVSHLLVENNHYQGKAWQILFSEVNRDKQFTSLRNGTEIFLKPNTGELLWGDAISTSAGEARPAASSKNASSTAGLSLPNIPRRDTPPDFSSRLANAVKAYYGKPYDKINCYGLVVRGLRRMGIKYLGSGGIRDRLVQLATEKGLPPNSFFNGEGLIEATGKKVFSRTFQRVGNADKEAERLFRDISPKLQKGDILSFSTESSGHTGIVSNEGHQWTFINSGDLDNTVSNRPHPAKGVGEENLQAELKNWLEKAQTARQSLQVTLGRLQEEKLRAAMQQQRPILSSTL